MSLNDSLFGEEDQKWEAYYQQLVAQGRLKPEVQQNQKCGILLSQPTKPNKESK